MMLMRDCKEDHAAQATEALELPPSRSRGA
jgi:hypothetical protein